MKELSNFVEHIFRANLPLALRTELAELFKAHSHKPLSKTRINKAPLSNETQRLRCLNVTDGICAIYHVGNFKIETLGSLKTKHIDFLIQHWVSKGNGKGTIENKIGYLQAFLGWLGKSSIIKSPDDYPSVKLLPKRSGIALVDKSWKGASIDSEKMIKAVAMSDAHIGVQLLLQITFAVRKQESMLLRPFDPLLMRNGERWISICHGTKGGRPREIMVTHDEIEVLEFAKKYVNDSTGSTIPRGYSLETWKSHYAYVMRTHGLTKNGLGVTSHGLRHEKLQGLYELITGFPSPVRGGAKPDAPLMSKAKQRLTEHAGHSMPSKSNAYIGSHLKMQTIAAAKITDEQIMQCLAETSGNKKRAAELLCVSRSYLYARLKAMTVVA